MPLLQIAEQLIGVVGIETGRFVSTADDATNKLHTAINLVWTYLIIGLAAAQLVYMAYYDCNEDSKHQPGVETSYLFLSYSEGGGYLCLQSQFAFYS